MYIALGLWLNIYLYRAAICLIYELGLRHKVLVSLEKKSHCKWNEIGPVYFNLNKFFFYSPLITAWGFLEATR